MASFCPNMPSLFQMLKLSGMSTPMGPVSYTHLHVVGDHVGELALIRIAAGIDPVVHALDLGGVGAVVGELVQPDEPRHRLEGKVVHHKARQGHGGQRGTAHRQDVYKRQHDIAHLGALIQRGLRVLKDHLDLLDDLFVQLAGNFAVDLLALSLIHI